MYQLLLLCCMAFAYPVAGQLAAPTLCGKCKIIKQRGKKRNFKNLKQLFQHLEFVPITSTKIHPDLVELFDLKSALPSTGGFIFENAVMDMDGEFWENGNGLTSGTNLSFPMIAATEEMAVHSYYVYLYNDHQTALLTFVPGEEMRIQVLE